jgi:hypothetical protein
MGRLLSSAALQCLLVVTPGFAQQATPNPAKTSAGLPPPNPIPACQISERASNAAALPRNASAQGDAEAGLRTINEDFSTRKKPILDALESIDDGVSFPVGRTVEDESSREP